MTQYLPYVFLAVSVAINIFAFVAPKTKNTVDDKVLEVLQEVAKHLPAIAEAASAKAPGPAA